MEPEKESARRRNWLIKRSSFTGFRTLSAGITVNVGFLNAGTSLGNAIAGQGTAKIDVKYWTPNQGKETVEQIIKICSVSSVPGQN